MTVQRRFSTVLEDLLEDTTSKGYTALTLSARHGHGDVATVLLDGGAALEARLLSGHTALAVAASKGHTAVASLLLGYKASVDARANNGRTALLVAVGGGAGGAPARAVEPAHPWPLNVCGPRAQACQRGRTHARMHPGTRAFNPTIR